MAWRFLFICPSDKVMPIMRFLRSLVALIAAWYALAPAVAAAAAGQAPSLIRDAEIEAYLGDYTAPIFGAAGIDPSSLHIYIVNEPRIKRFLGGGRETLFPTPPLV